MSPRAFDFVPNFESLKHIDRMPIDIHEEDDEDENVQEEGGEEEIETDREEDADERDEELEREHEVFMRFVIPYLRALQIVEPEFNADQFIAQIHGIDDIDMRVVVRALFGPAAELVPPGRDLAPINPVLGGNNDENDEALDVIGNGENEYEEN